MAQPELSQELKQRVLDALNNASSVRTMIQKAISSKIMPEEKLKEHDAEVERLQRIRQQFVD